MAAVLMVMTGVSRAMVIYPISALANKCRPRFMNIPMHYQHMLFYGGLIRGSVTVALAYHELGASVDEHGVPDETENDSAQVTREVKDERCCAGMSDAMRRCQETRRWPSGTRTL